MKKLLFQGRSHVRSRWHLVDGYPPRRRAKRRRSVGRPRRGYAAQMTPTKTAVLFDVDGTLVDSNYLHVYA